MPKAPATLKSIAEQLGVSRSTVSHVLNDRGDELGLRAETQRRVLEAAKRSNYRPDAMAMGLRGGRTRCIGVLWSQGGSPTAESMVRRIARIVRQRGYALHFAETLAEPDVCIEALNDFSRRRVDAVIIHSVMLGSDPEVLRHLRKLPVVIAVDAVPRKGLRDVIVHDRCEAYREVARHFVNTGRKSAMIVTPMPVESNQSKIDAFRSELHRVAGASLGGGIIPVPMRHDAPASCATSFYHAVGQWIDEGRPKFDALMCTADEGAAGALRALRERGFVVPNDVAVVGCNDCEFAPMFDVPLASIAREEDKVLDAIESMLFARLENPKLPRQRRDVAMRFVWRESAGATAAKVKQSKETS